MKNSLLTLILLLFVSNMTLSQEPNTDDKNSSAQITTIEQYITLADSLVESNGPGTAEFIGKVKGHRFFKKLDKNLLDPILIELYLIKNAELNKNSELKVSFEKLRKLHNNNLTKMQAALAVSNGYESIVKVSLKTIYKEDQKEIEKLATEFIELSYKTRTNQEHAGIIQIVLIAFKIGNLVKKFGANLEKTAKPIIIQNIEEHKLPLWAKEMNISTEK